MGGEPDAHITALLQAWGRGDADAGDRLMPLVYGELRRRAASFLRKERVGDTLQPTALVHEVYLRLAGQDRANWHNRAQFLAVAAQMMRRILVDRARARRRTKRSGKWQRITLDEGLMAGEVRAVALLDVDRALTELAALDARKSRIAELRVFGGLTLQEAGEALQLSRATVEREWQAARAWLNARLSGRPTR